MIIKTLTPSKLSFVMGGSVIFETSKPLLSSRFA
jgi:hypothetical protein